MKKIYLIDANSFIYRMFYGVPEFKTKSGEIVNAVFGIARFFLEQLVREKPDYIIFIKDARGENFRHKLDKNYKATRDKMPDNLRSQIPIIEEMIIKMQIPIIEVAGVEADDVIATLSKKYNGNNKYEIDILTGDKDLYSLVSDNIKIYDTMKKKKFGANETKEKFGVDSKMIIDYLAIVGDKSDNIPGIDGFGPKKAINLINIIGGIKNIYNFIDKNNFIKITDTKKKEILEKKYGEEKRKQLFSIFKGKTFEKLINSKENAFLSKKLATLKSDVNLGNFNLEKYIFNYNNLLNNDSKELLKKLEFNSLLGEEEPKKKTWNNLKLKVNIIDNDEKLDNIFNKIKKYKKIILDTETTSLDIIKAELVGISIYLDDENIFYINRLHIGNKISDIKLKKFLENLLNLNILIIGHNIKYDLEIIDLFVNFNKISNNKIFELKQKSLF